MHGPLPQGMFLARLGLFQRTGRLARSQPPARAAALVEAAQRLAEPQPHGPPVQGDGDRPPVCRRVAGLRGVKAPHDMTAYVALLRAVNVGGTGKLPMRRLLEFCTDAGFTGARTYIASGNVVFRSLASEHDVRAALESRLEAYAGKPVGVLVRSVKEIMKVVADNPFPDKPGNRVMALFTDAPLPKHALDGAAAVGNEEARLGRREIFVFYPDGMGRSRLRLPNERTGTARNMNTVAKLAELAGKLDQSVGT